MQSLRLECASTLAHCPAPALTMTPAASGAAREGRVPTAPGSSRPSPQQRQFWPRGRPGRLENLLVPFVLPRCPGKGKLSQPFPGSGTLLAVAARQQPSCPGRALSVYTGARKAGTGLWSPLEAATQGISGGVSLFCGVRAPPGGGSWRRRAWPASPSALSRGTACGWLPSVRGAASHVHMKWSYWLWLLPAL